LGFKNCRSRRKFFYTLKIKMAALTCKKNLFDCPVSCVIIYGLCRGNQINFFRRYLSHTLKCGNIIFKLLLLFAKLTQARAGTTWAALMYRRTSHEQMYMYEHAHTNTGVQAHTSLHTYTCTYIRHVQEKIIILQ
jgi:hypothetical protein